MDDPQTYCCTTKPEKGWDAKTRAQVPIDFYGHCEKCESRLEKMREDE